MAQFPGITLTNAGLNMIAESQASSTALIFTNLKMGDGTVSAGEDIKALTAVKNPLLTAPIESFTNQGDGQVKLRFAISNGTLTTGFFARELGIYAKIGANGTEQLYAYTNAGNLTDYIPDKNTPIDEQIIDIYLVVGNASSVKVVIDGSIMYATVADLSEHNISPDAHADIRTAITEATKKAGLPVGYTYTVDYTELQSGQLALLGGKYLKSTYADLWTWVQTHPSMIVTEEQWQALKTASGGRAVAKYADVDDQYFRVPLITTWVRGASSLDEVGTVLEAGLPNITGTVYDLTHPSTKYLTADGCLSVASNTLVNAQNPTSAGTSQNAIFDASKSSPIYGKSTTVQPQSVTRLWVVQAFGTTSNTGNMDVSQVAQGMTDLTGRVSTNETNIANIQANQDFTIIYPNNGSKEIPANVSVNSRYVCDSPFPGYEVDCRAEILVNGEWGACDNSLTLNGSNGYYVGCSAFSIDNKIVVVTGAQYLIHANQNSALNPFTTPTSTTTAPCRIKVWKIGKQVTV